MPYFNPPLPSPLSDPSSPPPHCPLDGPWKVCTNCCSVCIESMRQSQWSSYISQLKNASCAKELDRLLDSLPYYIKVRNW